MEGSRTSADGGASGGAVNDTSWGEGRTSSMKAVGLRASRAAGGSETSLRGSRWGLIGTPRATEGAGEAGRELCTLLCRLRGKKELNGRSFSEEEDKGECLRLAGSLEEESTRRASTSGAVKVLTSLEGCSGELVFVSYIWIIICG